MNKGAKVNCAKCEVPSEERICMHPEGRPGKGCPTKGKKRLVDKALAEYKTDGLKEFARQAAVQEGECYAGR